MSQKPCEKSQQPCEKLMGAALGPAEMIAQMVLDLAPDMGRERAIAKVANETGLSYSKTHRLFYRQSADVWSRQKEKMTAAFRRFAASQARLYKSRAAKYDELCQQIEEHERQHGIRFGSAAGSSIMVGGNVDGASHNA